MCGIIPLHVVWPLVHSRAVTDPTTEHHCEDHLEDLKEKKRRVWSNKSDIGAPASLKSRSLAVWNIHLHFQSDAHHDDSDHQSSQTNQVELLREQLDQFVVTALDGNTGRILKKNAFLGNRVINDITEGYVCCRDGEVNISWVHPNTTNIYVIDNTYWDINRKGTKVFIAGNSGQYLPDITFTQPTTNLCCFNPNFEVNLRFLWDYFSKAVNFKSTLAIFKVSFLTVL